MLRVNPLSVVFLAAFAAFITAQGDTPDLPFCPDPTGSATIAWPDDLYSRGKVITVAVLDSQDGVTTYTGIECEGNPHSMTIAAGDNTFSWERNGGSQGSTRITVVDECTGDSERMVCTITANEPGTFSTVTTLLNEDIYDVTVALGPSGSSFIPGTPTMAPPPYTGCPEEWFGCENLNGWCCPQDHICTTLSVAGHEACATGANDDFPGPALPSITEITEDVPSTGGMPGFPRPTQAPEMVVGGLLGLAVALL